MRRWRRGCGITFEEWLARKEGNAASSPTVVIARGLRITKADIEAAARPAGSSWMTPLIGPPPGCENMNGGFAPSKGLPGTYTQKVRDALKDAGLRHAGEDYSGTGGGRTG